jgi:large repetitive protein
MYALVVRNRGADDDPDVRVTDPMAEGLTLTSARPSQGSCSTDNNTVSCDLGGLRAGAAAVVLVTATTTGTPGCVTNTARVEAENPDPMPDNNEDSAQVCLPPPEPEPEQRFNLRVTKIADDRSVVVGEPVRYRVVVTNEGPAAAPDVIVEDALDAPVSVVDVRATQGSCRSQGPIIQCRLGAIEAGESVTITAVARHREAGRGLKQNAAGAISNGQDSRPRNNLAVAAVRVRAARPQRVAPPVTG